MTGFVVRRLGWPFAGLLLLAGLVAAPAAPALAGGGYCTAGGVSVAVDFHSLGGGVRQGCAASGGGSSAAANFGAAGFSLTRVDNFDGAVCKVDGQPASASCHNMPPANAYWALFWSDGTSGWRYSSTSVDGLKVPNGGTVAFSWQDGGSTTPPGIAPARKQSSVVAPKPAPRPSATAKPVSRRSAAPVPSAAAPSARASATAGKAAIVRSGSSKVKPRHRAGAGPSTAPTAPTAPTPDSTVSATPLAAAAAVESADQPGRSDSGGLPQWIPGLAVVLLGLAGGAAVVVRRRTGS